MWAAWGEQWELNHKVTFDGETRTITVTPDINTIDIKRDIYSAWKEWVSLYTNAKFLPALRTIGGDPIGGGQYAGDMYFLINNWQIVIDHYVVVTGIIFSDNFPSPFIILSGGGVTNKVSSLALAYATSGVGTASQVADAVWNAQSGNYTTTGSTGQKLIAAGNASDPLSSDPSSYPIGTAGYKIAHIEDDVRTELSTELNRIDTSISSRLPSSNYVEPPSVTDIWSANINNDYGPNSIGNWMRTKLLTVAKFIGLK